MVIALDVAGEPVAQLALEVITQVIKSPLARVVLVYVELVSPEIFVPSFFHQPPDTPENFRLSAKRLR